MRSLQSQEARRSYTLSWAKRNDEYLKRYQRGLLENLDSLVPLPRTGSWTTVEDEILLRDDISPREKIVLLQRNYTSLKNRAAHLKRKREGIPKQRGLGTPQPCVVCEAIFTPYNTGHYGMTKHCSRTCSGVSKRKSQT